MKMTIRHVKQLSLEEGQKKVGSQVTGWVSFGASFDTGELIIIECSEICSCLLIFCKYQMLHLSFFFYYSECAIQWFSHYQCH